MVTTPDELHENREHPGTSAKLAVLWIAIAAPVAGFADLIVSMIRIPLPDEYETASTIFAPLAATTVGAILVFTAIWAMLASINRLGYKFPVVPIFVSVSIAILSFETLLLLLGVLLPTELAQDPATTLLKLGAVCLISLALLRGAYPLGSHLCNAIHSRRSPALVVLAAPGLCALTLLLIWFMRLRLDAPLLSKDGLQMVALIGLAGLVLLIFFYFFGHGHVGRVAAFFPLCAVLLFPLPATLISVGAQDPPASTGKAGEQNKVVFLITIDSLRADTLSCYGSTTVQTNNIDSIAHDGVLFTTAISAAPWTLPAVASIMTGVSPVVHGATAWQKRLPDDFKTLAEYFKEAGYHTVALGQNPVLDGARNISQGFDEYQWISTEVRHPGISLGRSLIGLFHKHAMESTTEQITRMAIARLGLAAKGPTFYWIHYYDPHMPYTPPARFMSEADAGSPYGKEFDDIERVRMGRFATNQPERDWIKSLYEGEVRFVDEEFGRLVSAIKARGLYEDAMIVVSSDHGEEFWDHGGFEHGHSMHQELLRVPLIIKRSGSSAGGPVDALVGTEGLTPTILELAGLPFDATSMTSASFASYLNSELPAPPARTVSSFGTLYFEKLEAVTAPEYKFIRSLEFKNEALYDRALDPLELHPLGAAENPAAAESARTILDTARGIGKSTETVDKKDVVMDAGTEDSLRSLGYIN